MLRRKDVDLILNTMLHSQSGVSDLNVTVGKPLQVEAHGSLHAVKSKPTIGELTPYQAGVLALAVARTRPRSLEELVAVGSTETAYDIPEVCRLRAAIFQQRGRLGLVMRRLQSHIYTLEELGLPQVFSEIADEPHGLVLVSGTTGSGKSTTIAALLDRINSTQRVHVITLEDPVEVIHEHKLATFNQREFGTDFPHFASGVKAALKQAPRVIMIGELRDRETVELALAAAGSGHLVISSVHATNCGQSVERLLGHFEAHEEAQIRSRVADCLRWVVNQRLIPSNAGGRIAAQEVLGMNHRVRELVSQGENEHRTFYDAIASQQTGWQTFDLCLANLFDSGLISEETALANASRRVALAQELDRIKQAQWGSGSHQNISAIESRANDVDALLELYWPPFITRYPIPVQTEIGTFTLYEPVNIESVPSGERQRQRVRFDMPVQLVEPGKERRRSAVSGTVRISASGDYGSQVSAKFADLKVTEVMLDGRDRTGQVGAVVERGLPFELEMMTEHGLLFTEDKKEALERIAELGTVADTRRLKTLAGNCADDRERAALELTVKRIEER